MPEILVPAIGELTDAVLIQWRVSPGTRVRCMQSVAYLEADKGAIEVESHVDGVVERLLAEPGDTVAVGQALVLLRPA